MIYEYVQQFDKSAFKYDLKERLKKVDVSNYEIFENVLDKYAPKKEKAIRANSKPYVKPL